MWFYKTEATSFTQCYTTERPYIYDSYQNGDAKDYYEIPSILVGLAQIVQYYNNSKFKEAGQLCQYLDAAPVAVNFSRSMIPKSKYLE